MLQAHWQLALLMVASAVAAAVVHHHVYQWYTWPNRDEPVYVLQARALLDGRLSLPLYHDLRFFQPWLTGVHDGRLIFQFAPGWPALLAAAAWLTGTVLATLPLVAGLTVLGVYLLAREASGDRTVALIAAPIAAASPLMIMQSGLLLSYLPAFCLGVFATFALLRGTRTGRTRPLVAGGALLGAVFLVRPYDAALWAIPLAIFVVATAWNLGMRSTARRLGAVGLGAAPFVLAMLAFNEQVTGSPFDFPITAAYRANAIGFGRRGIMPGVGTVHFAPGDALEAVARYFRNSPPWLFGGLVGVVLLLVGASIARRAASTYLMLGFVVTFSLGYGLYWNINRAGSVPVEGPLYFLPMLIPVAVLGAVAALACWRWNRFVFVVTAVVAVAVTVAALAAHIDDNRTASVDPFASSVRMIDHFQGRNALVFVPWTYGPYLLTGPPNAENSPNLDTPTVFAADLGAPIAKLVGSTDRAPYRFVRALRQRGAHPHWSTRIERLYTRVGALLTVSARVENVSGAKVVTAYLRTGGRTYAEVLDRGSARGRTYDVTWQVAAPRAHATGAPSPNDGSSWIIVGSRLGPESRDPRDARRADVMEYSYATWTTSSSMTVVVPPRRRGVITGPDGRVAISNGASSPVLAVTIDAVAPRDQGA